jgi:Holliday junction resolvase
MRALRLVGVSVVDLSAVGKGCPDLLCGHNHCTVLLEVKDGSKPPSARKLTGEQVRWHAEWHGGELHTVTSVTEALRVFGIVP